jgi:hypothetical protein
MTCLGVPQYDQVVDIEDQGGGALRGLGDTVLWILETEELFHIAEADFQGPAESEGFQSLRGRERKVRGEEAVIAAAALGVSHYDDAQQFLASAGIP